jgi:hypothetical protein
MSINQLIAVKGGILASFTLKIPSRQYLFDSDKADYAHKISDERLASLGYIPAPEWRSVQDDPPPSGVKVLALWDEAPIIGQRNNHGMWFSPDFSWIGSPPSKWLPLPPLPGKETPK